MIPLIAAAALGLAAMGEGEEPEDEDLLTLLGESLSVEIISAGEEGRGARVGDQPEWGVFIYAGNKLLGGSICQNEYCAIIAAISSVFHKTTMWPLPELRELAVEKKIKDGESREDVYERLDWAFYSSRGHLVALGGPDIRDVAPHQRVRQLIQPLKAGDWYTDRKYA